MLRTEYLSADEPSRGAAAAGLAAALAPARTGECPAALSPDPARDGECAPAPAGEHPADPRAARLAELARQAERLRARHYVPIRRWATGLAPLDAATGGGLARGAVHELLTATPAAPLHTLALHLAAGAARAVGRGWVIYVDSAGDRPAAGRLYPPALTQLGLPLGRLLIVRVAAAGDVLWVCEQVLRSPAVGALVATLNQCDPYVSRRLQLAAEAGGGVGLLLRRVRPAGEEVRVGRASRPTDRAVHAQEGGRDARPTPSNYSTSSNHCTPSNHSTPSNGPTALDRPTPSQGISSQALPRAAAVGRPVPGGLGTTFAASRLWVEPLAGETQARRVRVTVLKLREGAPVAPFELEVPDAPGLVYPPAVPGDGPGAARHRHVAG
jgi:hypothetical protein